jgi:hypothetical protein
MDAGYIATGRDHTALAAANNHRLIVQIGVVAFFNRSIKRIAIKVGDA